MVMCQVIMRVIIIVAYRAYLIGQFSLHSKSAGAKVRIDLCKQDIHSNI